MKKKLIRPTVKYVLQEQPRTPESGLIQVWLKQQQQEGLLADLIGGMSFLEFQRANAGAAILTGTGLSVANLTEKILILYSVGTVSGSISCQMQSCSNSGGSGAASAGSAFGTAAGSGQFQLDMESFANTFLRSVVTITTGPTPVSILGMAQQKLV